MEASKGTESMGLEGGDGGAVFCFGSSMWCLYIGVMWMRWEWDERK